MGKKKSSTEKKAVPKKEAAPYVKKKGTPTWQYGLAAFGAFMAIVMMSGASGNPLVYVSVTDEAALRRVFFSGEVWGVACHSVNSTKPLPENFEAVALRLRDEMKFAVLDCKAALPGSGRTTMQRWKLKSAGGDPVLFVANGVGVQQIAGSAARSEYDLVRELRLAAVRRPVPIKNTEFLREKCLSKPRCLLVLKGGAELEPATEKVLDVLAGKHAFGGQSRNGSSAVTFAALDSQDLKLSFEGYDAGEAIKLRRFEALSHRAVYFRNTSKGLFALAHKGPIVEASLGPFLDGVSHDAEDTPNKRLKPLGADVSVAKRARKKAPPPPKPVEVKAPPLPKHGETLSAEDRERIVKEQQQRERDRRDEMEREAAESGHFAEAAAEDDGEVYYEGGDEDDEDDIVDLD